MNVFLLSVCGGGGSSIDMVDFVFIVDDLSGIDDNSGICDNFVILLFIIFLEFNILFNVIVVFLLDGCYVIVEVNGKFNYMFLYWDLGNESGFYVELEDFELFD